MICSGAGLTMSRKTGQGRTIKAQMEAEERGLPISSLCSGVGPITNQRIGRAAQTDKNIRGGEARFRTGGLVSSNYMLVEIGRAPNHQDPDREINCQRQEDFHRIVSQTAFLAVAGSLSPSKRSVYTRGHLRERHSRTIWQTYAYHAHKRSDHRRRRRDLLLFY